MRNVQVTALKSLDVASDQTSSPIDTQLVFQASVQVIMTGTSPTGVLKVQASNDPCPSSNLPGQFTPTNWTDISQSVSVSAAQTYMIPKFECSYRFLRLLYTHTSGTGTITAEVNALGY